MAVNWPSSLQSILNADSFGVEKGETLIRTDMDIGPAKVRRRFTKPVDKYTCSINMYQSDYATFVQFFDTTLNGGATTFNFVDPFSGTSAIFRFTKPPSISSIGSAGWYRVTMNWEKLP